MYEVKYDGKTVAEFENMATAIIFKVDWCNSLIKDCESFDLLVDDLVGHSYDRIHDSEYLQEHLASLIQSIATETLSHVSMESY